MKKILGVLITTLLLLNICVMNVCAQPEMDKSAIVGNWYGQYTGYSDNKPVERYMNMVVTDCDEDGDISGNAYITTVEGQGYDQQWMNYEFKGEVDFENNTFYMKGNKITDSDSTSDWSMVAFRGSFELNSAGELYVGGNVDNNEDRTFYFGRVSEWAKSEITEANLYGLIPDTIKTKDLSKHVTRAEFAAIAVQLYEKLTDTKASVVNTPFTDISGNEDMDSIKKAFGLGITDGVAVTEFSPESDITREQLATMLCRAIKKYSFDGWTLANDSEYYLDTSGTKIFADDADISDYAKPSVYYMTKFGIINGVSETHFAPKNITEQQEAEGYATATREQAISLSLRIFKNSEIWK